MKQILINLVQNALEASAARRARSRSRPSGGAGGGARVRVLDRGRGLDPRARARALLAGRDDEAARLRARPHHRARPRAAARRASVTLAARDGGGTVAELVLPGRAPRQTAEGAPRDAVRPRVLVVDDDPGVRYTLREILEAEGLAVDEAADGAEALGALRGGPRAARRSPTCACPAWTGWSSSARLARARAGAAGGRSSPRTARSARRSRR